MRCPTSGQYYTDPLGVQDEMRRAISLSIWILHRDVPGILLLANLPGLSQRTVHSKMRCPRWNTCPKYWSSYNLHYYPNIHHRLFSRDHPRYSSTHFINTHGHHLDCLDDPNLFISLFPFSVNTWTFRRHTHSSQPHHTNCTTLDETSFLFCNDDY